MTRYHLDNGKTVSLEQRHFIAKGGEKSIFVKKGQGYAVYHDPAGMIPVQKIDELAVLDRPEIIKPQRPILHQGRKRVAIGHTLAFAEGVPLVKIFPSGFQRKQSITPEMVIQLVKTLQDMVSYIHSKDILVVDLNELNFLVDPTWKKLFAIDVNSYQTPHFPATVIMPNILDRHCKRKGRLPVFDENTDWFSLPLYLFKC